ncbi:PepSY domain-containing protein [Salinimicrobium tongyeongense]|uniref:PepSY domain-containing protein n=1 Tax=Salinimicrobium tongyeongense TaxID=2809707 RepID=A0ABY6NSJ5_9FLAO|nr:PepSY-associated TM helix domain-containing protein [Salinimicrobium tongyeongense]UZH55874.1 PepSY domain-containing protein [Salinimicrobium tongyeongense]
MKKKDKKSKSNFKKWIRQIHLYLGLLTGAVVFVVAITGCLWVFQEEIKALTNDLPEIEVRNTAVLTPLKAKALAEEVLPGRYVHGTLYGEENEPVEVIFYEMEPEFYQSVFLHPYTGEVLKVEDHMTGFFHFILDGHMYLWLPHEIGSQVVGWSTFIFFLMLVTGIILWWPKNKKMNKQRFSFDWKKTTKWKRKNFDLHSVMGFYVSFLAVVIVFTGLVMVFEWFAEGVYKSMGGEKEVVFTIPENTSGAFIATENPPIESLIEDLKKEYPEALDLEIHYPYTDTSSIYVEVAYQDGVYYSADYRFYDQNTLEEIETPSVYGVYEDAGFSEKVLRMNYDIHVGAIAGLPGKIIAFFASLICASLPVTGFLLWYGRKFKKKSPRFRARELEFT